MSGTLTCDPWGQAVDANGNIVDTWTPNAASCYGFDYSLPVSFGDDLMKAIPWGPGIVDGDRDTVLATGKCPVSLLKEGNNIAGMYPQCDAYTGKVHRDLFDPTAFQQYPSASLINVPGYTYTQTGWTKTQTTDPVSGRPVSTIGMVYSPGAGWTPGGQTAPVTQPSIPAYGTPAATAPVTVVGTSPNANLATAGGGTNPTGTTDWAAIARMFAPQQTVTAPPPPAAFAMTPTMMIGAAVLLVLLLRR